MNLSLVLLYSNFTIYDCCVSLVTSSMRRLLQIEFLCYLIAVVQPHSLSIAVSPAHWYSSDSTTPASFHPIQSLPNTLVPSWTLKAVPTTVYRPRSQEYLRHPSWEPVEILGPDVQDRHTLSQLARMSGNAYALPGQKNWYDIDSTWNFVSQRYFHLLDPLKELPFWLGRSYRRLSWARLSIS